MGYAQGIDFRSTEAFVTDVAPNTFEVNNSADYPFTTPQGNNVGWEDKPGNIWNRNSSIDARLAGCHLIPVTTVTRKYRFDLPSATSYILRCAVGDENAAALTIARLQVFDSTTSLGVIVTESTIASSTFADATGARWSDVDWPANNSSTTETFASTILRFGIGGTTTLNSFPIAHLFVSSAAADAAPQGPWQWWQGSMGALLTQ